MKQALAVLVLWAVVLAGGHAGAQESAADANFEVLTEGGAAAAQAAPLQGGGWRRARSMVPNPALGERAQLAKGQRIALGLFADAQYVGVIDRIVTNINGTVTVRARIEGHPLGYALISTTEGASLGTISVPEAQQRFRIVPGAHRRGHWLVETDPDTADALPGAEPLIPPPAETAAAGSDAAARDALSGETAIIDVLIVYTEMALDWAANNGGMENIIAQALEKAQLVLDNSNTLTEMRLAHSALVDYYESEDSLWDLERLTYTTDGDMDEVHMLRDVYAADMVSLFAYVEDTGGIAWILNAASGRPDYAFSLCRVQQVSWTYTFIHEAGHNMGCHHHKEQNFQPGPGLFGYSAGWRWVGNDSGRYCSIMTYEHGSYFDDGMSHTGVAYFSNPAIDYAGVSAGHAADGDNARTVRDMRHVLAGYRITPEFSADINGDLAVNLTDLAMFSSQWLEQGCMRPGWCGRADLNADGRVNLRDFATLAQRWLAEPVISEGFETGDFSAHNWQHGGLANWQIVSDAVHEGSYAARSGTIGHNQTSELQITLNTDLKNIRFYCKVSCEEGWDALRFYIDDAEKGEWSGETPWAEQVFSFTPGQRTFRWVYDKDGSVNAGADRAWLDAIELY